MCHVHEERGKGEKRVRGVGELVKKNVLKAVVARLHEPRQWAERHDGRYTPAAIDISDDARSICVVSIGRHIMPK